jgi:4-amino-4-deoxy-L-arabinose transferase-like glycosyltransferase
MVSLAALAIVLLAFFDRIRRIAAQSFWWDEAYSAVVARGSLSEIVAAITAADFHPPLHYVLFHYWRLVAGESEYALRFTAVAAGTLTVALAFATGRRLFGTLGGIAATLLFTASPFLVYYSTEARMFSLAALFALLATYLGHRAVDGGRRDWLLVAAALAIGAYNYYYAIFAAIPIGLLALARAPRKPSALVGCIAAGALAALVYAPWLPIAFGRAIEWTSPWTPPTTPQRVLAWTWPALLTGIPAYELWRDERLRALMAAAAGLAALALLAVLVLRRARYARSLWYAAAAALVPLGCMAAIAIVRPIYHPRYATPVEPGLLLLFAGAIALPSRWMLPLRVLAAIVVLALFGWGLWRYEGGDGLTRDDYRSAIGYVAAREQPGDTAITNVPPGFDYYYHGSMPHRELPVGPYREESMVAQLAEAAAGHPRLWYVTHDLRPSDPEGFVDLQLDHRADLVEDRKFGQLRVRLYALPPSVAFAPLPFRPLSGPAAVGGELELLGIGLDNVAQPAGAELPITLRWRVKSRPTVDIGVFARLRDDRGFAWGRDDRRPLDERFLLSSEWRPGDVVTSRHGVPVAPGTPPGTYTLEVGAYRLDDLKGLEVVDASGTRIGQTLTWDGINVRANPEVLTDPALKGPTGPVDEGVALVGSGVSAGEAAAGSSLDLTLLFRTSAAPGPRDLVLRLVGPDGAPAAEQRGAPLGGRYPADRWTASELVRDQERLAIPPTLAAGTYGVWVGLARPGAEPAGVAIGQVKVSGVARRFELPPIEHPLERDFGDGVRLVGWALARSEPTKGKLTLYWRPSATPSRDYHVFNHVLDRSEKILTQRDGVPAAWGRPTAGWVANEVVEDSYDLDLPAGAGPLKLRIGVYDPVSGKRLLVGGDDHLDLTELPG